MSIAKSDEIKNLLVSNSELMVTTAYPHTYCRVVPLQTACEIVNNILENRDMHKTIAEESVQLFNRHRDGATNGCERNDGYAEFISYSR